MNKPENNSLDQVEIQVRGDSQKRPRINIYKDENHPKFESTLDKAGIFSKINFLFVFPLALKVWKLSRKNEELTEKDLLTFEYSQRAEITERKFMNTINEQKQSNPNKTVNSALAIFLALQWRYFATVAVQTAFIFFRIFQAHATKKLIECACDLVKTSNDAYYWATVLVGTLIMAFYCDHHWNYMSSCLGAHAKAGIVKMLYNKITRLSLYSITKLSAGQLVNLAANDSNTFEMLGFFSHSIITGWLCIIAGTAYLWVEFGAFCLLGIVYLLLTIPVQAAIAHSTLKPRDQKNLLTDDRVMRTGEIIEDIRFLKMYGWENKFKETVTNIRNKDIKVSKKVLLWEGVSRAIANSSQHLAAFIVFYLYHVSGGDLTVAQVYAGYFLLTYMKIFGAYFVYNSFIFFEESKLFFRRVDNVMEAPEIGEIKFEKTQDQENSIEFKDFNGYWAIEEDGPRQNPTEENMAGSRKTKPTLSDINLIIKKGSLNAIVGTVGCGKSSLLLSFTGEMPHTTGVLRYNGTVAYVEQEPIIFAGTFREGILFGKEYREDFYKKVIKVCNLENDLKLFPQGDMSIIGERGNNLSGGQKARFALARAVYADADIYLLDDPLSAVDSKVAKSIFNDAILGLLKDKTVLLVTHQVHFVRDAKNIIVMEGGQVKGNGTFAQLQEQGIDVAKVFNVAKNQKSKEEKEAGDRQGDQSQHEEDGKLLQQLDDNQEKEEEGSDEAPPPPTPEKDPYPGQVSLKTYVGLFKEVGLLMTLGISILYIMTQVGELAFSRILGVWTAGDFNLVEALATLGGISIYMLVFHILRNVFLSFGLFRASRRYHDKMLDKVMRSPVSFFDINPVGRILNRFSDDIGVLDRFFPQIFLDVIDASFDIAMVAVALGMADLTLLLPCFGSLFVMLFAGIFYYPTLKITKSFDLESRGPLFSLYSATISGVAIIRTYGQTDFIKRKFSQLLHTNTKGNLNFTFSSRLLGFTVDLLYTIGAFGMIFLVTSRIDPNDPSSGALAGFALIMILSVTGSLQHGIRQFCQTNVLMAATARVQAYSNLPTEAPLHVTQDDELIKQQWPQTGTIKFNKVYMKYRPENDFIIKDLDLEVNAGEKIGCVGRTGAGKSTIINLLFRLQEIDRSGENATQSSIQISETNTLPLGLHLLRKNISIIPQTPFIFTGTIRENLDPFVQFTDQQIWDALAEVRLKDQVAGLSEQLETAINGSSSVFSVGQKQLVCLARALLKPCKVLVLDEATANMDTEIDNFIQNKIMEKFAGSTVFTIAHRLTTIANYDKVLVLDKGRKVEFDAPIKLLANAVDDNTITNTAGHFSSMVLNTGPRTSQHIFNIAKETYQKKQQSQ